MAYWTIIWTFRWLWAFVWRLTCLGWSAGAGEQLRQAHAQSLHIYILIFYYYCFHSVDVLKINNVWASLWIYFVFRTIFISFLMMGNWLSFYLIIWKTLIKKDTFCIWFYDNSIVNREMLQHFLCWCVNWRCRHKNSYLCYNIETQNRLATKVNNTEWLKRKKELFPIHSMQIWRLWKHLTIIVP